MKTMKTKLPAMSLLIATLLIFAAAPLCPAEIPDADWPPPRQATEDGLNAKIEKLQLLIEQVEKAGLDAAYARSALVLAKDFIGYARDDEANGRPGRAKYTRGFLDEYLDRAASDAEALIGNPRLNRPVPHPPLRDIAVRGGAFFSGDTNVMFGGMGHFGQVRRDTPKFPDYGFNIIQIEIGPNSVITGPGDVRTDAITGDILKAMENAEKSGIMINLLLSPHYFPQWATDMYPKLKQCGMGFIQYCVSDPRAREVLERFLRVLIPLVKDSPALHSYTLANEPLFYEHGEIAVKGFQQFLEKKYGEPAALNRAWRKKYSGFGRVKYNADFFNTNVPARRDWVEYHNGVGTEFFQWMKSVIRSMDTKTPMHIKFMDNMFQHDEVFWGIDREALEKFTEISGNDSSIGYPGENGYAMRYMQNAAFFDFLKSMRPENPIMNSENHIIADDTARFYPANYIRAALLSEYVHGMAASTMWVWERGDGPSLGNNVLSRANCAAAVARTTLDVRRLAPYITALSNTIADSPVAIYYSQDSRVMQVDFRDKWDAAYQLALDTGRPARIVTDSAITAGLDPNRVRLLILPEYIYTSDALYEKLLDFVHRGGRIVAAAGCFRMNEQARTRDTSEWDKLACAANPTPGQGCVETLPPVTRATPKENFLLLRRLMAERFDAPKPELEITGEDGLPVLGVEYRSTTYEGKRLAYVLNALDRTVKLRFSAREGAWPNDATDLLEGGPVPSDITMNPMDVVMFLF